MPPIKSDASLFLDKLVAHFICQEYLLFVCITDLEWVRWWWYIRNYTIVLIRDSDRSVKNSIKSKYHIEVFKANNIHCSSVRGALGSTLILAENFGILLAFILGNFCDYYTTPIVVIGITILCAGFLFFLHESPRFLVKRNKIFVSVFGYKCKL